ncbi:GNAT family protein [Lysinibacillus sp. FSL H8-0500]|uniref:N-acetyltransferase domain-containing protein n=1 Tax=Lysinibacillus macroides TaxID=33935 RepID=A0A0N0UWH4_9BACI|nr:GNAT family protein [Lysinibacillus macroides]KOY81365.1 hypothetical protein ADM90_19780 [Lysinibacillus macroides]QPR68463.1 GNAT family N-acetyltransferase [Lysinibacillus macroides]
MIKLQPFTRNDYNELIANIDSKKMLLQWAGRAFEHPLNTQQLDNYLNNNTRIIFKAVNDLNYSIGHIALQDIDFQNRTARIGKVLVFNNTERGKGYGLMMIQRVLELAFKKYDLNRVSLGVFDFNESAIRCYEKAGFVKEGLLREVCRYENEFWNLYEMSILKREWTILKERRSEQK